VLEARRPLSTRARPCCTGISASIERLAADRTVTTPSICTMQLLHRARSVPEPSLPPLRIHTRRQLCQPGSQEECSR